MKIYLAADHAGFYLKEKAKVYLSTKGYGIEDCGAFEFDKNDDYPDFIAQAARCVLEDTGSMGIVFGGSGQGEQITANKFKNIRCALFYGLSVPICEVDIQRNKSADPFEIVRLSRLHNNANILSLAVRFLKEDEALKAIDIFINTPFSNEARHARRIEKIKAIEILISNAN